MKRFSLVATPLLLFAGMTGLAQEHTPTVTTSSAAAGTTAGEGSKDSQAAPQAASPQAAGPQAAGPQAAGPQGIGAQAIGTAPAGSPTVDSSRYVIGADDFLQVTVWREPTLSGTFPVRPDGMISLVLAGDIPAAGMTPMQLGAAIAERLKKYIQDPSVSVVVTAVNSQRIFLVGEVGHGGPMMLTPGMTPLQAIAAAGGLSNFANSKHIYILRGVQGKQQKIPFNYKQALKGDNKQIISLQPGDTIVVP